MKQAYNMAETALNIAGITISVNNLNNILNIIILILSICSILFRVGYNIYVKIKNKKYDEIDDELKRGAEDIEKLKKKDNNDEKQ